MGFETHWCHPFGRVGYVLYFLPCLEGDMSVSSSLFRFPTFDRFLAQIWRNEQFMKWQEAVSNILGCFLILLGDDTMPLLMLGLLHSHIAQPKSLWGLTPS